MISFLPNIDNHGWYAWNLTLEANFFQKPVSSFKKIAHCPSYRTGYRCSYRTRYCSCRTSIEKNDREQWFQGYGGGIELVAATGTMIKWKQRW